MRFKRSTAILSKLIDNTMTNTLEINDFSVGSAIRALYEAVSIELEQFYMLTRENITEGIEQGVYSAFGFVKREPIKSSGIVEIIFHNPKTNDSVISRGSQFSSGSNDYPQVYETLEDVFIPRGAIYAEVEVYCLVRGEIGNIPANVIDMMRSPIPNIKSVNNPRPFMTGQDEEPIEELHARFNAFIESRGRATMQALEYGVRTVEEVSGVYLYEQTGRVTIYAHDKNGNLTERVKNKIHEAIQEYRPAGIQIIIAPVSKIEVDVNVLVTLTSSTAKTSVFKERIHEEITNYLNNMEASQDLILSELSSVIRDIDKKLIYDVAFVEPEENLRIGRSEVIRAGQVIVSFEE